MQGEAIYLGLALRVTVRRYLDFINSSGGTTGKVGMWSNVSKWVLTERSGQKGEGKSEFRLPYAGQAERA
jgi:hypothetical protein